MFIYEKTTIHMINIVIFYKFGLAMDKLVWLQRKLLKSTCISNQIYQKLLEMTFFVL